MIRFFHWMSNEKLMIVGLLLLGGTAAAYQEWSTVGLIVGGILAYLKGDRRDGQVEQVVSVLPPGAG
jgi:hypothetical protein